MASSGAQMPYEQLAAWPRYRDEDGGGVVLPGEVAKLPGTGDVVRVQSVSFGDVARGAYVNGFYIDMDDRLGRFERKGSR